MKKIKKFCRLLFLFAMLLILFGVFYGFSSTETVTLTAPANAPANTHPDLPWELTLVNRENGLPQDYSFTLVHVGNGVRVDRRIVSELKEMLSDAKDIGYDIFLNSGYRTSAEQQQIFDDKVADFRADGYDDATARALASQWASLPGRSEHELGLAVDIGTATPALYDWLAAESWRYGFIQRYPYEKTNLTGVSHEPWHYRYVGEDAASEMHAQGLCLEEYVALYH